MHGLRRRADFPVSGRQILQLKLVSILGKPTTVMTRTLQTGARDHGCFGYDLEVLVHGGRALPRGRARWAPQPFAPEVPLPVDVPILASLQPARQIPAVRRLHLPLKAGEHGSQQ